MLARVLKRSLDFQGAYQAQIRAEKSAIHRVADCIAFPARDAGMSEYGLRSGGIDDGNLTRLASRISHSVFQRREIISKARRLIVVLLDLSGSMNTRHKIQEASKICRLLIESWKILRIDGADLALYGHTAEVGGTTNLDMVRFFDRTHDGTIFLGPYITHAPLLQNLDGFAIHAALTEAWKVYPGIQKSETSLIVISDGKPQASIHGYDSDLGLAHTARVIRAHQRAGVHITGIGIANAMKQNEADYMYGPGNTILLGDVLSGLPILTKKIRKICDR
jgi:Mg-chelatase subunit ChlD